jgi:hypothetical protein
MAVDYTTDAYLEQEQQAWGRQHNRARQVATGQKKGKALEKKVEKKVIKIIAKVFPKVASATGVGVVASFIVLFIRGVRVNLLGNKDLPKLDMGEQVHFGILMFVVFIIVVVSFVLLFAAIIATSGIVVAIQFLGTEILDWFKSIF